MTAELRGYYRELDRHLNCPRKLRLDFHRETRRMADELAGNCPGATPQNVSAFLGEPAALAATFQETIDPAVLSRYRKRRRAGRWIAGIGLALVLCIGGCVGWVQWSQYAEYQEMFDEIEDADWVIVQHGPREITEEEYYAIREAANTSSSLNGG